MQAIDAANMHIFNAIERLPGHVSDKIDVFEQQFLKSQDTPAIIKQLEQAYLNGELCKAIGAIGALLGKGTKDVFPNGNLGFNQALFFSLNNSFEDISTHKLRYVMLEVMAELVFSEQNNIPPKPNPSISFMGNAVLPDGNPQQVSQAGSNYEYTAWANPASVVLPGPGAVQTYGHEPILESLLNLTPAGVVNTGDPNTIGYKNQHIWAAVKTVPGAYERVKAFEESLSRSDLDWKEALVAAYSLYLRGDFPGAAGACAASLSLRAYASQYERKNTYGVDDLSLSLAQFNILAQIPESYKRNRIQETGGVQLVPCELLGAIEKSGTPANVCNNITSWFNQNRPQRLETPAETGKKLNRAAISLFNESLKGGSAAKGLLEEALRLLRESAASGNGYAQANLLIAKYEAGQIQNPKDISAALEEILELPGPADESVPGAVPPSGNQGIFLKQNPDGKYYLPEHD